MMVQARWPRAGADNAINTFVFDYGLQTEPAAQLSIRDRLDTFYQGQGNDPSFPTQTVISYLSNQISGPPVYYMRPASAAVGDPGTEVQSLITQLPPAANRLPEDVAICLSYRAPAPYTARRRGRIYLGPLNVGSLETTGRIKATTRTVLNGAAANLSSESATNPVYWSIASRVGNVAADIVEGFVDQFFDTQRRRDPSTETFGRTESTWTDA